MYSPESSGALKKASMVKPLGECLDVLTSVLLCGGGYQDLLETLFSHKWWEIVTAKWKPASVKQIDSPGQSDNYARHFALSFERVQMWQRGHVQVGSSLSRHLTINSPTKASGDWSELVWDPGAL